MSIRKEINQNLEAIIDREYKFIPSKSHEVQGEDIIAAVKYITLNTGSLWRPRLLWAVAQEYDVERKAAMFYGSIVEAVHAGTLALDDLPSQDNAIYRRGRLCSHKFFAEKFLQQNSNANITEEMKKDAENKGISLTELAIYNINANFLMATNHYPIPYPQKSKILDELWRTQTTLPGGQAIDLYHTPKLNSLSCFADFYRKKTGSLFGATAAIGAILGDVPEQEINYLRSFGEHQGIAYQFADDLVEFLANESTTGKSKEDYKGKKNVFDVATKEQVLQVQRLYQESARKYLDKIKGREFRAVKYLIAKMENAFKKSFK